MPVKTAHLLCPNCKKPVAMTEAFPERPFCSKRCKAIDFGSWANEDYYVEVNDEDQENWSEGH